MRRRKQLQRADIDALNRIGGDQNPLTVTDRLGQRIAQRHDRLDARFGTDIYVSQELSVMMWTPDELPLQSTPKSRSWI